MQGHPTLGPLRRACGLPIRVIPLHLGWTSRDGGFWISSQGHGLAIGAVQMSLPSGAAGLLHPDSSEDRPSQRHPCSGRPHCASTASRGRASPATQGGHVGTPMG
jgi:hypothetical protein